MRAGGYRGDRRLPGRHPVAITEACGKAGEHARSAIGYDVVAIVDPQLCVVDISDTVSAWPRPSQRDVAWIGREHGRAVTTRAGGYGVGQSLQMGHHEGAAGVVEYSSAISRRDAVHRGRRRYGRKSLPSGQADSPPHPAPGRPCPIVGSTRRSTAWTGAAWPGRPPRSGDNDQGSAGILPLCRWEGMVGRLRNALVSARYIRPGPRRHSPVRRRRPWEGTCPRLIVDPTARR